MGQGSYARDILRRFCINGSKPMNTPNITNQKKIHNVDSDLLNPTSYHQLIESLMHLVNIRRNIYFTVNSLSQFMMEPRRVHWVATKHVSRYVYGTIDYGLVYIRCDGVRLISCKDSDWVGSVSGQKITFICCF